MLDILLRVIHGIKLFFSRNQLAIFLSVTLAAISFLVLIPYVVVTVQSGELGVLFHRFAGTEMKRTYPEGLHLIFPWDKMYVYNVRVQKVRKNIQVLAKNGLPIDLIIVVRYRPDFRTLTKLHRLVGPQYLDLVVLPEVFAVLRRYIGLYDPVDVYTTKHGLLDQVLLNSLEQTEQRYVIVDDVLIESVILPETIRTSIEKKLVFEQEKLAYVHRLELETSEAERKRIEARGIRDYHKTVQETLSEDLIRWQGVQATRDLATSTNAKTVIIGGGRDGLPVILGNVDAPTPYPPQQPSGK